MAEWVGWQFAGGLAGRPTPQSCLQQKLVGTSRMRAPGMQHCQGGGNGQMRNLLLRRQSAVDNKLRQCASAASPELHPGKGGQGAPPRADRRERHQEKESKNVEANSRGGPQRRSWLLLPALGQQALRGGQLSGGHRLHAANIGCTSARQTASHTPAWMVGAGCASQRCWGVRRCRPAGQAGWQ